LQIDLYVAAAGLFVGFTVGLTGMGGGALMTPLLVLAFNVQPLAAVSSDLVAAVIMKPVGGGVHLRRGTVNFGLVRWLMIGSVPAAFAGVLVLRALGDGAVVQARIKQVLGVALLTAASSIAAKGLLQVRALRRATGPGGPDPAPGDPFRLRPLPTVLIGVVGGLVVGMTSVGSGSLIIVLLLLLYPMLRSSELVGTDLVQAVPLVASAAVGHLLFGDFKLDLTLSLLVGSIPGVYLGAKLSSRANDVVIRPALALVLVASGLKLLGVDNLQLGLLVLALVLLAVPLWGALDATLHPEPAWSGAPVGRRMAVGVQLIGAPIGLGFVRAGLLRPATAAAGRGATDSARTDERPAPIWARALSSSRVALCETIRIVGRPMMLTEARLKSRHRSTSPAVYEGRPTTPGRANRHGGSTGETNPGRQRRCYGRGCQSGRSGKSLVPLS